MLILNPWNSKPEKLVWYNEKEPVYTSGDGNYSIYHQFGDCWLYAYKNMALTQLAGLNKELINNIANRSAPKEDDKNYWLYIRALESLEKCKELLNNQTTETHENI